MDSGAPSSSNWRASLISHHTQMICRAVDLGWDTWCLVQDHSSLLWCTSFWPLPSRRHSFVSPTLRAAIPSGHRPPGAIVSPGLRQFFVPPTRVKGASLFIRRSELVAHSLPLMPATVSLLWVPWLLQTCLVRSTPYPFGTAGWITGCDCGIWDILLEVRPTTVSLLKAPRLLLSCVFRSSLTPVGRWFDHWRRLRTIA